MYYVHFVCPDKVVGPAFPIAVFGALALLAAATALLLPETSTRKLPDTVKEAANVKVSFRDGLVKIGA